MTRYIDTLEARVAGIPCLIGVTTYNSVKGSHSYDAPSDWDYHGYTDIEFDVLDRRGRPAAWLERKMKDQDREQVEQAIVDHMSDYHNAEH